MCATLCAVDVFVYLQPVQNTRSRYDWHQTGSEVIITIYSKGCVPEKCSFEANSTVVSSQMYMVYTIIAIFYYIQASHNYSSLAFAFTG